MPDPRLLSVVVPVYNESDVIQAFYERATAALSSIPGFRHEIIFVNDGSRDDSQEQLAQSGFRQDAARFGTSHFYFSPSPC
jgi:polyisoprenyl-phosphate glycosyltransferase